MCVVFCFCHRYEQQLAFESLSYEIDPQASFQKLYNTLDTANARAEIQLKKRDVQFLWSNLGRQKMESAYINLNYYFIVLAQCVCLFLSFSVLFFFSF